MRNNEMSVNLEKNDKLFVELLISQEEHGNSKEFLEKYNELRKEERELFNKKEEYEERNDINLRCSSQYLKYNFLTRYPDFW